MSEDNPGVLVRPPFLYLGALMIGAVADTVWPASLDVLITAPKLILGAGLILFVGGVFMFISAVQQFTRAGTSVQTSEPVACLVIDGVYRLSRNPIYVGFSCVMAGLGLVWDNPWVLVLLAPVILTMHFGVILREETYLTNKFGDAYKEFMLTTRRWL